MKKIPTLLERMYDEKGKVIGITDAVKPGFEWVLAGEGLATIKMENLSARSSGRTLASLGHRHIRSGNEVIVC